jgi:hypothetical protein
LEWGETFFFGELKCNIEAVNIGRLLIAVPASTSNVLEGNITLFSIDFHFSVVPHYMGSLISVETLAW